jgi:carotenoid cleavage dioxygenase
MSHSYGNVFGFSPDKDGNSPPLGTNASLLAKWVIDPKSEELNLKRPEIIINEDNEFLRVDDRYICYKSRYIFGALQDKVEGKTDWKLVSQRIGGTLDLLLSLARH